MKFKNLETNTIIEVNDKGRIAKFQGYPDKFEQIIEAVKDNSIKPRSRKEKIEE